MTYAKKTLSEIKLIHGDFGNFIKGQKLDKRKEKKYKTPPYKDLAASNEIDGESLDEKCWPGYEKKGMKTMFGKRYPNCVKKKKTKKEEFSDWRSELEQIEEKKMTKAQIKKRDEIADAISTKEMNKRYGDKNVKYAIATKLAMKEDALDENLRPLVKGFTHFARKLAKKRTKIPYFQLNRPDLTYVPKKSKLAQYAMYHGTSKKSADKIIKSGKFKKSVGDVLNPDGTVFNAKRAFATTDPKKAKFYANKAARRDGSKPEILAVKVRDSNIYNPASIPNEYYVKTKHMKPVGRGVKPIKIKKGEVMQNSFNPLEEKLNSDDKPFVKKLVGKLRKGSKTHAKQADDLEKAMKENLNLKFHLGGNKKEISLNYGNTPIAYKRTEKFTKRTEPKVAIDRALNKIKEDITDEALTIQNWNVDDIKFTEIETVDIIKPKPLKESHSNWKMELDEGIKRKFIKKLAKKIAKQLGKKKPKITGDVGVKNVGQIKKYVPPSKDFVKKIQTKSIINQVKKASDLSSKPVKGTTPVKVDVSKPINFDKYFGGSPTKSVKKKFGSKRPTGTFTDDAPKVKREPLIKAKKGEAEATEKLIKKYEIGDKIEKKYPGRENAKLKKKMYKRLFGESNWREELGEDWQKVNRKDKTDGMSKAAVKAYRRENPGSKLKTAVTKDPKKLKKGSKSAKRRLAFCRRMKGMKKRLTSAKTARDPNSRINKALRRWNC